MSGESLKKAQETRVELPLRLHDLIGYHLKRASARDLHGANTALEATGMRTVSMSVLLTITERPGVSSAEICRILRMQRANIVSVLAELESRGLFLREADPDDNRIQRLFPTAKGREEAQRMLGLIRAHEEKMLAGLTLAERGELHRMLAIIWREDGGG
ncbi:MarR family winged helix-turn-helix transcriptional regulator [Paracoccus sp. (in: a-proteobacteria)]|uniref:MarR family winged helix-turn-helix transcriptional regulator n=1 Tax=Paracoccus sp. TaxID=267 RepID=UPI002AFDD317|nr:winged helix DNA-binding protein [Paracoccus sp. (in: a-proteobacteria)]